VTSGRAVRAYAPGRVNLIGDHTDYSGGLVLPMAIDLGTTVVFVPGGPRIELTSSEEPDPAVVVLDGRVPPSAFRPEWARYVAAVAAVVGPVEGGTGRITSDLPVGAGLSSSAALEVSVALALGFSGPPLELAQACQRAEQLASGVPCGIMDQLASVAGVEGHALLIDCASLTVTPTRLPGGLEVVVVHSGERRALAASAYATRRAEVEAAAAALGRPLRAATLTDTSALADPVLRRRARHVVSENTRVTTFADALRAGDALGAGELMAESHASLRGDFDVSTPGLDALVEWLNASPGVLGARLTGGGFGGCAVALTEEGAGARLGRGWVVHAANGAYVGRAS
jgi:galactokinase